MGPFRRCGQFRPVKESFVNPKSLNAAIFFVAVQAREMQRDVDGPAYDIAVAMVRSMRTMTVHSYVGSRMHPQALAQMNGVPFDDLCEQVGRILSAIEDGNLVTDPTYAIY